MNKKVLSPKYLEEEVAKLNSSPEQTRRIKNTLTDTFKTLEEGLQQIENYKPKEMLAQTMGRVRRQTQALAETMERARHTQATLIGVGKRRKTIRRTNKITPVAPLIDKARPLNEFETGIEYTLKGFPANKKAPYNRPAITGTGLTNYMLRNKLNTPVDIIKSYKKDSSLKAKSWTHLIFFLRQLNFEPQEVFEYAITAVDSTKERWNKHRIFREYEKNESGAVEDICLYYKKHLKAKAPLKIFYGNEFFNKWCLDNNVLFSSEENFRQNLKKMVKDFNKKYPKDKIPEKLK